VASGHANVIAEEFFSLEKRLFPDRLEREGSGSDGSHIRENRSLLTQRTVFYRFYGGILRVVLRESRMRPCSEGLHFPGAGVSNVRVGVVL